VRRKLVRELKSTLLDKLFQIILYIDDAFTEKVGSNSSITTLREQLVAKLSALLLLRDLLCRVVPTKDFVGRPKFLSADMSGRFVVRLIDRKIAGGVNSRPPRGLCF